MEKFSIYQEYVDDDSDESDESGTIYELEIQSESSIEDESVEIGNEIIPADKDEDLEIGETDNLIPPCEDNLQIKKESEELSECKSLSIKTEEVWIDDGCDNNERFSDTDSNEKYSEINEQMKFAYASNIKRQSITFRKVLKIVPDYLHINSKEKNINIELLQLFKLKPHIWNWNHNQIKSKKANDYQKEYESIAKDINSKFLINVSWEFVKNRIDEMRFICCDEMEKELSGEEFQMPWFFEHMKYLKKNLNTLAHQRIRYRQKLSDKIDESRLLIIIEFYKKYEELWQVNNIYFYIQSKRVEAYNKLLEELKSDYNIKLKLRQLKDYIKYIYRVFTEDKTREIKSEIDKSDFSPASKYYDKLTFLKDSQGPFKCPHCNDIIQNYRSYLIHVAEHTNSPPFKCVLCERQYRKYISFKAHIRLHVSLNKKHVNSSIYECDICNKKFFLKKSLDNHQLAHNYLCQICDTGFGCSSIYDEHMRSHEKSEDNIQIKEEDEVLSDCEFLSIGEEDDSYSQMTHSTASNSEIKDNKFRKRSKCVPDYLHINSTEKNINIALLQLFELKPYIWNYDQRKFIKGRDFQNDYESIAKDINSKFSINVSWKFVKNRINEMRYICIDEIEKELNGEEFQMPWYFEHMKYLKRNLKIVTKQRTLYKQSRIIDESILLIVIELYKKHDVLWHVNNPYFGILSKRTETYKKMIEELKSDYNIKFKLIHLKNYVNYMHRIFSEDKTREIKSELDKSEFSPASKHYDTLTFLKDSRGPFKCPHCNDIIQKFESYHIHVAEHTNTIPFKCKLCKRQYKQYIEYIRHIRYHILETKSSHRCDICNKCFTWKKHLDRHKLSHKNQYQCQICDASFRQSKPYDEHMRRHEKGLRLECHICKKDFDKFPLLKNHLKCHPNVPDYLCKICGKGFTTYSKFRWHKHRDKKRFKCDICGKIYTGKKRNHC